MRMGEGFCADARFGECHLRLFAVETGLGPGASVFDVKTGKSFSNREWADDMEDAKARAARMARGYHRAVGTKDPFPELVWKETSDR
jgi:hypothetical protein